MMTVALPRRWTRLAAVALVAGTLAAGCEYTEITLQATIDSFWKTASEKAKLEADVEAKMHTGLNDFLTGKKVLDLWLYSVYIHDVENVDVNLGSVGPKIKVPSSKFWGTPGHLWYSFPWALTWAKGNGAKASFKLDLRPAFPDHTVKLSNLDVVASGDALIDLDVKTGKVTVEVFTKTMAIDLKAEAEGWFWTLDVKDKVKKEIQKALDEKVIDKVFSKAFGES